MASAQHYLGCALCEQSVKFYCKYCHENLCEDCALKHVEEAGTKNPHQVAIYSEKYKCRDIEQVTPKTEDLIEEIIFDEHKDDISSEAHEISERCAIHPAMFYGMCCKECKVPVCITCIKERHNGHVFIETLELYNILKEDMTKYVSDIKSREIPLTQTTLTQAIQGRLEMTEAIRKARSDLVLDAELAKKLIDQNLESGLKVMDEIENLVIADSFHKESGIRDTLSDLQNIVRQYDDSNTSNRLAELINCYSYPKSHPVQKSTPIASDITYFPRSLALEEAREMFGYLSIQAKGVHELKLIKESTNKKTLIQIKFPPIVEKIMSFEISGIAHTSHISYVNDGIALFSDNNSKLVFANERGEVAKEKFEMLTSGYGCHAVTQERDLLITDLSKHQICKLTKEQKILPVIKLGAWTATALCCSQRNGDILVGMFLKHNVKIVRYNNKGNPLFENPQNKGNQVYHTPCYLSENINGDVCVSDWNRESLIVSDREGCHRFSYSGSGSRFYPRGILNDDVGRIFVCDGWGDAIHILNKNGQMLALVKTKDFGVEGPLSLCCDGKGDMWIGNRFNSTITVVKITVE